ncbi:MAG: 50S ribosomal protein L19 [Candidatus Spechtbacterales bacterium]
MNKLQIFAQQHTKQNIPPLRTGDTVRVHEKIKEKEGERIQIFEGVVIYRKHGKGLNGTFTVRKIAAHRVGVEKTYPIHSPNIQKIEVVKHDKVRRAKLYYLRDLKKKKRKKPSKMLGLMYEEVAETPESKEAIAEESVKEQAEGSSEVKKAE